MNLLSFLSDPSSNKRYDIGMIKLFNQWNFWFDSRAFRLWQVAYIYKTPRNFSASIVIDTSINSFISTPSQLFWKSFESPSWRNKHEFLLSGLILFIFLISWEKSSLFTFIIFMLFFAFLFFWLDIIGFNNFRYMNLVYS